MNKLADYYKDYEVNYDEMKKNYLMAIEKNETYAMYKLADYYKDYDKITGRYCLGNKLF